MAAKKACMILFVAEDGTVIRALDLNGKSMGYGPGTLSKSIAGSKIEIVRTLGEDEPEDSCCFRMVGGKLICKPEYCRR